MQHEKNFCQLKEVLKKDLTISGQNMVTAS